MESETGRYLSAEEQIDNLRTSVEYLTGLPWSPDKAESIRDAEAQLEELTAQHARGDLAPVWFDEETPF